MLSLRKLAKDEGLRQRELAELLKTDQSVISLIVNGHRRLNEDQMQILVNKYGVEKLQQYDVPEELVRKQVADLTIFQPEVIEDIREDIHLDDLRSAIEAMQKKVDTLEAMIAQQNRMLDIMERMLDNIERK